METFFASCPRGLEPLLVEDLVVAGARDLKQIFGGVHFLADWPVCYRANLHSRIATRILWRVGHARYGQEDDIYALALATPWPRSVSYTHLDVYKRQFMHESRRLVNVRVKKELRAKLRYPRVEDGVAAAWSERKQPC